MLTSAVSETTESYAFSLYEHQQQVLALGRVECPNARVTSVSSDRIVGTPSCRTCFQVFHAGTGDTHELRFLPLGSLDYQHFFLPSSIPSFLPPFLHSFLPSSIPSFLPSFLHFFLPSSIPSFLPSFLSFILSLFRVISDPPR
ncbi:hypothetical protein ACOMHN_060991 [Nucella lapillus]